MNVVLWIVVFGTYCVVAKVDYSDGLRKNLPTEKDEKIVSTAVTNKITVTKRSTFSTEKETENTIETDFESTTLSTEDTSSTLDEYKTNDVENNKIIGTESDQNEVPKSIPSQTQDNKFEETSQTPVISSSDQNLLSYTITDATTSLEANSTNFNAEDYPCSTNSNVTFINITVMDFNVTLYWDDNSDCVQNYSIVLTDLTDQSKRQFDTYDQSLTILDLYSCTEYTVTLTTFNNTLANLIEEDFKTTIPETFSTYSVEDVMVTKINDMDLEVKWDPPAPEVSRCVTTYYIVWWDTSNNTQEGEGSVDANHTSTTLPVIGCMDYNIQIVPKAGETNNGKNAITNYTADPYPSIPPDIIKGSIRTGKKYANVTWLTNDRKKTKCEFKRIIMNCVAPKDSNCNYSWIVWNKEAEELIDDENKQRFPMSVEGLSPFTNYSCDGFVENIAGNSTNTTFTFCTEQDVPPISKNIDVINVTASTFRIVWAELEEVPGVLTGYGLLIGKGGPQSSPGKECMDNVTDRNFTITPHETSFDFEFAIPYYRYIISLYGIDLAGNGPSVETNVTTDSAEPESVVNLQADLPKYSTNDTYYGVITVRFDPPCYTNGPFKHYEVSYKGSRDGYNDHSGTIQSLETSTDVNLFPDRNYSINIIVVTEKYNSSPVSIPPFHSQAGVPIFSGTLKPPVANDIQATFQLSKNMFNETNGAIIAYGLFLFSSKEVGSYGFWNGTWPSVPQNSRQLTPNFWNPFKNGVQTLNFTIGIDSNCSTENYCNKPLDKETKYWLMVRAFTTAAYKDSSLLGFETEMYPGLDLKLILGLTFGLLAALVLIIFLVYLYRRKRKDEENTIGKRRSTGAMPIPVQNFLTHYANIKEDPDIITEQYSELGVASKQIAGVVTFANLPENRRKNRYTNILPYDATRVTLKIDEDDEISSDYINASYIKGYSGRIEYIACQGPLESTTRDFWKMVLQENVSIIAMVSQFVENSKEKCFQYVPNNHESLKFGENLEVKCSTELHFGTYCVRTLQVRKNKEQRDVVHMQFLEWPDFGVPQGTDNMIEFCSQLREKVSKEGGLVVVHCSAGVGRTGTLIALDILFQTIQDRKDINIYKTVLDLRKQRTNMVQTEKQFLFIHTCVKDYLEAPCTNNEKEPDRIYENMDVLRSSLKKNLLENERESAL